MDKVELIQSLNIKKGHVYLQNQLPAQISNAIYQYGSSEDYHVILYVDLSTGLDGSKGLIFTENNLYFQLTKKGQINYQNIQSITLKKNKKQLFVKIQTKDEHYTFSDTIFDIEQLCTVLSKLTTLEVSYDLSLHEKVLYDISIILSDIENNEYEDLELDEIELNQLDTLKGDMQGIYELDDQAYILEIELLLSRALEFFDQLGLDSDEIDELVSIREQFNQKQNQAFEQAKSMASNMGVDMDLLKNKSPEELNQMVDDLCDKFHISRNQVETLAKKFMKH
ncbi:MULTISPECIES: hypothetical protein [Coprobacillaceae]|uniref:hypothetical protein n=1 Tax=Coprobacillaceae TaxID=2810280 RepID=UPI000E4C4716|nr:MULTISPECIES: hypothetical protein [Coprobacillaceae]RHM58856.1 hypothetical protein DWZ53_10765 [Coprobacillus sp. AF33-1AC]RHS91589.1 hypothetical protein DW911_10060 [Erysipelatoclostridium sp. AM42-17]